MMVYLDKEPARFDSIFRDILDNKEVICPSKGFMQGEMKEKIRKNVVYFLEQLLGRTSVSFFMEFNH